jgi:hypothetical protein
MSQAITVDAEKSSASSIKIDKPCNPVVWNIV